MTCDKEQMINDEQQVTSYVNHDMYDTMSEYLPVYDDRQYIMANWLKVSKINVMIEVTIFNFNM